MESTNQKQLIFIISGPSGIGKTTLCSKMIEKYKPKINKIITATTRYPRKMEKSYIDYIFFDKKEFKKNIKENKFYEYSKVHGYYYGILESEIKKSILQKIDLLINLDVQGAKKLMKNFKNKNIIKNVIIKTIFMMPISILNLKKRLEKRGEKNEEISIRINNAEKEILESKYFDYCFLSTTKNKDFKFLIQFYMHEKNKIKLYKKKL